MTDYGLPKPDHKLLEAHPTVSSELLPRLGHGDIAVKPNIDRFAGGRTVRFADGSEEEIDLVVYCTGYKIDLPVPRPRTSSRRPTTGMPLYRRVVSVEHPGLYFIGFIQPLGPIMPLAEAQAEWVADLLSGRATLPSRGGDAERRSPADERKMRKRFVASKRHTVEVDFHPYLREIRRERKRAAAAGLTTRVRPPGRAVRQRHRGAAAVGPAARAARQLRRRLRRLKPPSESSARSSGSGVACARPPDQPDRPAAPGS